MAEAPTIVDIAWERVNLTFVVEFFGPDVDSFHFTSHAKPGERLLPIAHEPIGNGRYRLRLNVTQFNGRGQVPNGAYLVAAQRGSELSFAGYPLDRTHELMDRSRAFIYNSNHSAYTVTFGASDDEGAPCFVVRTYSFSRDLEKPSSRIERTKRDLRDRWSKTKRKALRGIYAVASRRRPANGNNILFASELRTRLEGNLKAVHDRMVVRGLNEEFNFAYSFRTGDTASRLNAVQLAWQMGIANTILIDDYFDVLKDLGDRDTQKIIQLWHAGSGFKSVGYSRFGQYGSPQLRHPHRTYSFAIAGSQQLRDVYSEAFGIERESVIATGLPRIDGFLREGRAEEYLAEFERDFPDAKGKRKVLFAPTFRGWDDSDAYYDYDVLDFAALYEACGEDSVVLFRQHHFISDPAPIPAEFRDRLIDVASCPDTNDLMLISAVLITDYSSVIYEYSLLERPMIFFAYDVDTYSATRGFHRDYREAAPGSIATTFEHLLSLLREPSLSVEKSKEFVKENFDYVDTNNSDRVIDWLILSTPSEEPAAVEQVRDPESIRWIDGTKLSLGDIVTAPESREGHEFTDDNDKHDEESQWQTSQ